MSRDEFWSYIEQCRQHSDGMPAFTALLEKMLDAWELPKLAAFHKVMWSDVGVYHGEDLWDVVAPLIRISGDDSWECYGGWLIAQGRMFHEAVLRDSQVAATRVPARKDIYEGESVIFMAQRVCAKKTDGKWGLYDLFGIHLDGKPQPGVDWPVTW
jgi:uncharacterized protein DUF4240